MKKVEEATAHLPPAPKPEGMIDTAMGDTNVAAKSDMAADNIPANAPPPPAPPK
jgi:hypothetical protein